MFNFKSFLAVFLLCFSTLLFVSCEEQELSEVVSQQQESLVEAQQYEDYTYENIMYEGRETTVRKVGDKYLLGDIVVLPDNIYLELLRKHQASNKKTNEQPTVSGVGIDPLTRTNNLWPGGVVVYEITQALKNSDINALQPNLRTNRILEAISILGQQTNLTFRERTPSDIYFIHFEPGVIDNSQGIGRKILFASAGNGQHIELSLKSPVRTIIHEIGHAIGLQHEQNRPDRLDYINLNLANADPDAVSQYDIDGNGFSRMYGTFDFQSIMLYGSFTGAIGAFSGNVDPSRPVMTRKDNGATWQENQTLSAGDISAINTMYAGQTGGGTGNPPNNTVPNDVPTSHWAYNEILYMWQHNYIVGNGTSFTPQGELTRAEFAAMIVSVINPTSNLFSVSFSDIGTSSNPHWARTAILQAARAGYLSGSNGLFRPNDKITKQEMTISLINGMNRNNFPNLSVGSPSDIQSFADYASIATWARVSVQNATKSRLVANHPNVNNFTPNRNSLRAEAAMMFYQVLVKQNRAPARSNPFLVIR